MDDINYLYFHDKNDILCKDFSQNIAKNHEERIFEKIEFLIIKERVIETDNTLIVDWKNNEYILRKKNEEYPGKMDISKYEGKYINSI